VAVQLDVQTSVERAGPGRAPVNQFAHFREFPDASNKQVVASNVDTPYSLGGLDLTAGPIMEYRSCGS
jgi:hypothetical protein